METTISQTMPSWLLRSLPVPGISKEINSYLKKKSINTVCVNSRCPNMCECYKSGNVSFLILGRVCTRNCLFCAIKNGTPEEVRKEEPNAIAEAVKDIGLQHVVITSVTRDDLPDGGASHYREVSKAIKILSPFTVVEVLAPDFKGSKDGVKTVIESGIDVFAHNMETVKRLYAEIRPQADYSRSLDILRYAASFKKVRVKSGFMLGLGETEEEVMQLMHDIKNTGCDFLTIGQYLSPKGSPLRVREYVHPDKFELFRLRAQSIGFTGVLSGPFVRSSYKAGEML